VPSNIVAQEKENLMKLCLERIKSNFNIQRLSDADMKALDDLEVPNGQGRSIDFTESWGVKLWQK